MLTPQLGKKEGLSNDSCQEDTLARSLREQGVIDISTKLIASLVLKVQEELVSPVRQPEGQVARTDPLVEARGDTEAMTFLDIVGRLHSHLSILSQVSNAIRADRLALRIVANPGDPITGVLQLHEARPNNRIDIKSKVLIKALSHN